MADFTTLETDGKLTLFVNSKKPPYKEIPLDYYRYTVSTMAKNDIRFFRLYRIVYQREIDGFEVTHALLDWRTVEIQEHCISACRQLIDSMQAVREFLVPAKTE